MVLQIFKLVILEKKIKPSRLIPANINHSLMQTIIFNITNKTWQVLKQCSLGQGSSTPMVQRRTVKRQEEGRKCLGQEMGEPWLYETLIQWNSENSCTQRMGVYSKIKKKNNNKAA